MTRAVDDREQNIHLIIIIPMRGIFNNNNKVIMSARMFAAIV